MNTFQYQINGNLEKKKYHKKYTSFLLTVKGKNVGSKFYVSWTQYQDLTSSQNWINLFYYIYGSKFIFNHIEPWCLYESK